MLHHGHKATTCQLTGDAADRCLPPLKVLNAKVEPMLSDRFMEFQIDGLEETTHRIPEVWTRQGNGNASVDLLPVGGRELLLDLSCSGLIEGTCCTHHLLVVTRPLETFNPQPARKERAFKSTRGCRSTDGGHAVPATCVPWDAAGAPLTASPAHGFRGPRARPRGEQSHRDGGAFGRRRGITSTNVTSVTVPANHTVIDAGLTVGTVWSEDGSNGTQFAHDTRTGFQAASTKGRKDCSEVAG